MLRAPRKPWVERVASSFLFLVVIGAAAPPCEARHATKPMPRVTVTGKVLVGDPKSFRTVAVVDRRSVFEAIPAFQTLRAERTSRSSARYHFLIYEANRAFQRAVEAASLQAGIDLVVESGGVTAAGIAVVDLTHETTARLGRAK